MGGSDPDDVKGHSVHNIGDVYIGSGKSGFQVFSLFPTKQQTWAGLKSSGMFPPIKEFFDVSCYMIKFSTSKPPGVSFLVSGQVPSGFFVMLQEEPR